MEENEFTNLVNKYNNSLWKIFKKEIDEAIKVCQEKNFNDIKTYCYIISSINAKYAEYKRATTGDRAYPFSFDDGYMLLPADVEEKIFNIVDYYHEKCYKEIKKCATKKVYNLADAQKRDQTLKEILDIDEIFQYKDSFESFDFDDEINTK